MIKLTLDSLRNGSEFHGEFAEQTALNLNDILNSEEFARRAMPLCERFRGDEEPAHVAAVRSWTTPGDAYELTLEIALAVDFPSMPGEQAPPPQNGIVTPYWFIDECIRREDHAVLGAQWIREWLVGTFRETTSGRSPSGVGRYSGGNMSRPEFLLPPGLQALVDFAVGIHDAVRDR